MFEDEIQRVQRKLARGRLRLNAPLPETAVSKFEADHGVRLPDGYREFLLHVGNGGAGPYYGLLPLDQWAYAVGRDAADLPKDYLASPSHLVPDSPQVQAPDDDELFHQGTITLVIDGCGFFTLLVVSGPARGQIVGTDGCGSTFFYGASGFLHWYETWLDDHLGLRTSSGPWFESRSLRVALEALEPGAMRRWWQFWR
jgi:hypothetical protein